MKTPAITTSFVEASCARPLRAWSQAQQEEVRDILHRLLLSWQTTWALVDTAGDAQQVTVQAADQAPTDEQTVHWRFEESPLADFLQAARRALQVTLFGETAHLTTTSGAQPILAPEIIQLAWNDWQQRLKSALGASLSAGPPDTEPDRAVDPWSGALHVRLPWCGTHCTLLIPGSVVSRLVQAAGPRPVADQQALTPLAEALHGQRLLVQARLRDVTLSLGELEHLSTGDVVLLPHHLEAPLQVLGPDEEVLCTAWLGQQSGHIALELSPLATPA